MEEKEIPNFHYKYAFFRYRKNRCFDLGVPSQQLERVESATREPRVGYSGTPSQQLGRALIINKLQNNILLVIFFYNQKTEKENI